MHKLFGHDDRFLLQRLRSELDALGIPYLVKNEFAGGAVGELPWQDVQQEIWLLDEAWFHKASQVVVGLIDCLADPQTGAWVCENCGENNDGGFDICWHCQHSRPT
ncbi:DUF2007 domain-containing protein [Alteromonas pelagimontana]|uniref:DUF2007 domain-containing protein n=1 Tax=Alteromonas pelagimontana TaxID=1858656 RepID=A0A6M4MB74_9ALTE|nr:DUF2007 domain-containing protein [Alteromonas pelagimontana]QJR80058.1 DUF2007 domain-containing protein [Alteromonas pelagimontana]